jgi:hypothetical protein
LGRVEQAMPITIHPVSSAARKLGLWEGMRMIAIASNHVATLTTKLVNIVVGYFSSCV